MKIWLYLSHPTYAEMLYLYQSYKIYYRDQLAIYSNILHISWYENLLYV